MREKKVFLSADWRHLAMLNYEIEPSVLLPYVPAGTELDVWQGKALVSVVGFMFLNTRVKGWAIPFHGAFEEVNLRFYVRRAHGNSERRAVTFIKEIVPRHAIALVARYAYNENYVALPMRHARLQPAPGEMTVSYEWRFKGRWNSLSVRTQGESSLPEPDSEAAFIMEHYWGYARQPNGRCKEYRVDHVPWRHWRVVECALDADVAALYGVEFADALSRRPRSAFLADGSAVTVYDPDLLK